MLIMYHILIVLVIYINDIYSISLAKRHKCNLVFPSGFVIEKSHNKWGIPSVLGPLSNYQLCQPILCRTLLPVRLGWGLSEHALFFTNLFDMTMTIVSGVMTVICVLFFLGLICHWLMVRNMSGWMHLPGPCTPLVFVFKSLCNSNNVIVWRETYNQFQKVSLKITNPNSL